MLSTDPAAGTQAQPGSKVTMQVSKGNQDNQLPDVVGQTVASAAQILSAAGYTNLAVQGSQRSEQHRHRPEPQRRRQPTPDKQITLTRVEQRRRGTAPTTVSGLTQLVTAVRGRLTPCACS